MRRLGAPVGPTGLIAVATFAALLVVARPAHAVGPAPVGARAPVSEEAVHDVAAQLRCVVCQSLSVADSPSETAQQMKDVIRERLASGESPEQVRAYFVEKYGPWILLSPPRQGFSLLVWVVPFAGLGLGLVLVLIVVHRWSRRPTETAGPSPLDAAMRARIRREMAEREP
jgi:cytochrome c-type biogenesis protein CcmH